MHTFFGTQTAKISLNGRFTKNDSIKQDPRACVWEHHIVVTNFNNEKPILVIAISKLTISKLSLANQRGRHPKPSIAHSHRWKTF